MPRHNTKKYLKYVAYSVTALVGATLVFFGLGNKGSRGEVVTDEQHQFVVDEAFADTSGGFIGKGGDFGGAGH